MGGMLHAGRRSAPYQTLFDLSRGEFRQIRHHALLIKWRKLVLRTAKTVIERVRKRREKNRR